MRRCDGVATGSLIDLHYGLLDPDQERACRAHLAGCADCSAELEDLSRLSGALRADEAFPSEPEVDWDAFARTTVKRAMGGRHRLLAPLTDLQARWREPWGERLSFQAAPAWAAAASLVVFLSLGVIAYNSLPFLMFTGPDSQTSTVAGGGAGVLVPPANLDNLTVNLARNNTAQYLKETRAVLVTLLDVNIECDKDKVDISAERAKATELLRRQRLIASELHRLPLARAQDVCDELEKLLLEVASLGDCTKDEEIRTLRDVVEKRQILVRMEILSQELAAREGTSA